MNYYDFNDAEPINFNLIPQGTIAKVSLMILAGGYNDHKQGWFNGYATRNELSEAVYFNCQFTILQGEYAKRKIWGMIGLYSQKNNNRWGDIGRSFIRSMLNSAKGFSDKDNSDAAQLARRINSFADLNGLEFIAKIDIETDKLGNQKNVVKSAIDTSHKDYNKFMDSRTDLASWM